MIEKKFDHSFNKDKKVSQIYLFNLNFQTIDH